MGRQIVYCSGCGKSILEQEFEKGKAQVVDLKPFCSDCKPIERPLSSSSTSTSTSREKPAFPSSTRIHTARVSAAPDTGGKSKSPLAIIAVLVVVGAAAAFLMSGGRQPSARPTEERIDRPTVAENPPSPPPSPPPKPPVRPAIEAPPPKPSPVVVSAPPPAPEDPKPAEPPPAPAPPAPKVDLTLAPWQGALALATDRDYAGAIEALKSSGAATSAEDSEWMKKAAAMMDAARDFISKWPRGQKIALDIFGDAGKFERVEGLVEKASLLRLEIRKGEGIATVETGEIAARSLAEIYVNRPGRKPEDAAVAALVCLLEGDLEAAKTGMKGVPQRFVDYCGKVAATRVEPREAEARKMFLEAERDAIVGSTTLEAIRKHKTLVAEYGATGFVRRNRASIANLAADLGREYFFVAGDMAPSGCFALGKNTKAKIDPCWICDRDLDATVRDTFVDLSFGALAEMEYRCWVYVGGCCQETLSFLAQAPDTPAPLPVKIPYIGLKARHSQHVGPKEPDHWTWVSIPLPKVFAPGVKTVRLFTTQKGFGVAYAIVTSIRGGSPRDAELKELEKSRAGAPIPNPLSADDLVAYWKFDEGSGATVADSSGKGHTGQFRGDAKWGPGRSGTAVVLSGNGGFVEVAHADDLCPATITMAAWVHLPVIPPKGGNFISKGQNFGYRFRAVAGPLVQVLDRGAENVAESTASIPLNQWTHVAVTGDAAGLKIYINGKLAGSGKAPFGAPLTKDTLKIGAETEFGEFVVGSLDEVCLFKKALTAAEVQALCRLGPKVTAK